MTDQSMIERVARALYANNAWWRIPEDDDDGRGTYQDTPDGARLRRVTWEDLHSGERKDFLSDARVAIETMREPTEAMIEAGIAATRRHPIERYIEGEGDDLLPAAHRAMIDAALQETVRERR